MSLLNSNKKMLLFFTVNQLSHTNIFLYSSGSSWNRLVSIYLYGSHNLITFFDLNSILFFLRKSLLFSYSVFMKGGSILTVNPDTQNRQILKRSFYNLPNLFFVNGRWVGGTLTNFRRIFYHLLFMIEYCKLYSIPLQEISPLMVYFRSYFEGISQMKKLPSCVFVLSYYENYNNHFLRETSILGIPSLGSFNCKENLMLDLCIPSNGSNTQSLEFFSYVIRNSYLASLIKHSEICKNNNYNLNNVSFKKYNSYKFLKKHLYNKLFFLSKKILLFKNSSFKINNFLKLRESLVKLYIVDFFKYNFFSFVLSRKKYFNLFVLKYNHNKFPRFEKFNSLASLNLIVNRLQEKLRSVRRTGRFLDASEFRKLKRHRKLRNQINRFNRKFLRQNVLKLLSRSKITSFLQNKNKLKFFYVRKNFKKNYCKVHYKDINTFKYINYEIFRRKIKRLLNKKNRNYKKKKLILKTKSNNQRYSKFLKTLIQTVNFTNKHFFYESYSVDNCLKCYRFSQKEKSDFVKEFKISNKFSSFSSSNQILFRNKNKYTFHLKKIINKYRLKSKLRLKKFKIKSKIKKKLFEYRNFSKDLYNDYNFFKYYIKKRSFKLKKINSFTWPKNYEIHHKFINSYRDRAYLKNNNKYNNNYKRKSRKIFR